MSIYEESGGLWSLSTAFHGSPAQYGDDFGWALSLDGDALLVGAPNLHLGFDLPLRAFLFDLGAGGPFQTGTSDALSLSKGGKQTLSVGACSSHAGDIYAVAGGATGTSPGFVFGSIPVPLNPDAYFLYTLNHVGAPPLSGAAGLLDENGFAQASVAIQPGTSPSLAGLTLHHAHAVLDGATLQLEAASPAVPAALVP